MDGSNGELREALDAFRAAVVSTLDAGPIGRLVRWLSCR